MHSISSIFTFLHPFLIHSSPLTGGNPQTGPVLHSCSVFEKKTFLFVYNSYPGSFISMYMYYNLNWFIPYKEMQINTILKYNCASIAMSKNTAHPKCCQGYRVNETIFLLSTIVPFLWWF
jgi:hypothetical protein